MLTILSTPKRFSGIFEVIQTNAITSWTQLDPRPEIILFGRDEGTAEICAELGPAPRARRGGHRAGHAAAERHVPAGPGARLQPGGVLVERRRDVHRRA